MSINNFQSFGSYVFAQDPKMVVDSTEEPLLGATPTIGAVKTETASINASVGDDSSARILPPAEPANTLHLPSLICIMSIGFIANCEYGVVMPSILGYIVKELHGTESQMGIAVAACSLTQLCFLPIFGYWSDRRTMKEAIMVAMIIGITGNVIYASAGVLGSPTWVIIGRALVGVYMGIISVTNSFVALVTTPETRTKFMAQINGINALGLVAGPGFNMFLVTIKFKLGPWKVDANTAPGWFIAILVLMSFIGYLMVFKEPQAPPPKKQELQESINYGSKKTQQISGMQYVYFVASAFTKPYGACFIICFVQNFDFSVLETIATMLTDKFYKFESFKNSLVYSALSLEMVVVIFVTAFISRKKVQDRLILLGAQTCVGIGVIFMFFFYTKTWIPLWQMMLFACILVAGIPSQNISVMSLYSKLLTAEFGQAKQGLYTGIIMIFGSLARILGPIWGGSLFKHHSEILFGGLIAIWALDVLFTLIFFKKLKPMTQDESGERVSLLAH